MIITPIIAGIIWGSLVTYNIQKTELFKCKVEKIQASCEKVKQLNEENKK